ncbi:MAG: hypothetical protein ACOYN4_12645 [Bacteroidales bacterium]
MKTRNILLLSLMFFVSKGYAQEEKGNGKNEAIKKSYYLGYGIGTINAFRVSNFYITKYPFRYGDSEKEAFCTGAFIVGYHGNAAKKFSLTASLVFENIVVKKDESKLYAGNYLSLISGIKWNYGKAKRKASLYGRFDLGLLIHGDRTPKSNMKSLEMTVPGFTLQLSPLCFRYGGKIGGYFEFGFGSLGLINAGLDYRI